VSAGREPDRVEKVLRDLGELREGTGDVSGDPELEAVKIAILLEDSLGITLTEDEIDGALLGDPSSVTALLARRAGGS
jgi:hypothetical protein